MNIDSMSVSDEYNAFLEEIEQEERHDQRLFEAQCALLEAGICNECAPRPTTRAELVRNTPWLNWARATIADHRHRQRMAATLAVRNAIAAMKTHSVATAIRMRRHFTPKRGHVSRGASLRAAAKSGDSNDDGDPDPDDRVILDPYSAINDHHLSTPQNRISRKAILAHRGGIGKTHPRVYSWYLSRALREIETAIIDTISDHGRVDLSPETHDEAGEGAWIFFQRLCKSHDFGETPNLVFFGRGGLVYKNFVRSPDKLHAEIARDCYNPGQKEHRKKSVELGIVKQNRKEFAADIYAVAHGLAAVEDAKIERKWWRSDEEAEERAKEYQGVKIQHLPPQPIRERSYHLATKVSLDSCGEDGDGSDRLEWEAIDALADANPDSENWQNIEVVPEERVTEIDPDEMSEYVLPDTESFDHESDDVTAPVASDEDLIDESDDADEADEETLRAGTIARQLILHVQRARDKIEAAQEVAEALNTQPVSMQNSVVEALRKDFANVEVVNAILRAAGFAELEHRKPESFSLDAELTDFANRDENALEACPDMYYADFMKTVGGYDINSSNVLKLLRLRAENAKGFYSPEVQKAAAILLKGYEMQKGVRV
jgi:hypothetical protein